MVKLKFRKFNPSALGLAPQSHVTRDTDNNISDKKQKQQQFRAECQKKNRAAQLSTSMIN